MSRETGYKTIAYNLNEEIQATELKNVPNLRVIRKKYSKILSGVSPEEVLEFVRCFFNNYDYYWVAFEILSLHKSAIKLIGEKELKEFGTGIDNWGASDIFAAFLAGPAWRNRQVPDRLIISWARSEDFWWRRTALVCTVFLNKRSAGGKGDVKRTLKICSILAGDKNDKVVKAMSWALRELIVHDAGAVKEFLRVNENLLAARVKREVNNKLKTGVKNPKYRK